MDNLTIDFESLRRPHWTAEETKNAKLITDFVSLLMNQHDFEAIRSRYGSDAYLQHNHGMSDGIPGVVESVTGLTGRFPEFAYDVKHILVDGDVVIFHSHATLKKAHRGDVRKGFNITDRWRIVDGEIVEHWDSIQPIDGFGRMVALFTGGAVRNHNGSY